jgi:hypothetical protein
MSEKLSQTEKKYSENPKLQALVTGLIEEIKTNSISQRMQKVIKTAPTFMMLPAKDAVLPRHQNEKTSLTTYVINPDTVNDKNPLTYERFEVGNLHISYSGIDKNGNLISTVKEESTAVIKPNSVILQNPDPICYPKDHPLTIEEIEKTGDVNVKVKVKGYYVVRREKVLDKKTGEEFEVKVSRFVVDQNYGDTFLVNEYVSDTDFVKRAYGPSREDLERGSLDSNGNFDTPWLMRYRLDPSFVYKISEKDYEHIIEAGLEPKIISDEGKEIKILPNGYIAFDTRNGEIRSMRAIEEGQFEDTYSSFEEYLKTNQIKNIVYNKIGVQVY